MMSLVHKKKSTCATKVSKFNKNNNIEFLPTKIYLGKIYHYNIIMTYFQISLKNT